MIGRTQVSVLSGLFVTQLVHAADTVKENEPSSSKANPALCVVVMVLLLGLVGGYAYHMFYRSEKGKQAFEEAFSVSTNSAGQMIHLGETRYASLPRQTLLVYRVLVSVLLFATWLEIEFSSAGFQWQTYTFWNFTIINLFFLFGIVQSVRAYRTDKQATMEEELAYGMYRATKVNKIHAILGTIALSTCLLVTGVVWLVLYPNLKAFDPKKAAEKFLSYNSIIQHVFNSVFLLADFFLSNMRVVRGLMVCVLLWPVLYSYVFATVWFTTNPHFAVYPFLRLDGPISPLLFLGLFLLHAGLCEMFVQISICKEGKPVCGRKGPGDATYGQLDGDGPGAESGADLL
jgi:hypothetical protein